MSRRGPRRWLVYLWALPNTLLGLALALLALPAGRLRRVGGVLEAEGPLLARVLYWLTRPAGGARALTLGHVILGRNRRCLDHCRAHEHVHVRQYERWGPFFLPAYLAASLIARLRGGDHYRDNAFEREAFGEDAKRRQIDRGDRSIDSPPKRSEEILVTRSGSSGN